MDRSTAKVVIWIIVLLIMLLGGIAAILQLTTMAYLVAIIGGILIVAIAMPFHTCPHCGHILGRNYLDYTHCPHCGELLQD